MNQKERMLAGLPYKAWLDGLSEERLENKKKIFRFNNLAPDCIEEKDKLIKEILGKTGQNIHIEAPFHCDYGYNIEVGENFFANYNFTVLDVGKVRIGTNKHRLVTGMVLSVLAVAVFIAARQPYAGILCFALLVMKTFGIMKLR